MIRLALLLALLALACRSLDDEARPAPLPRVPDDADAAAAAAVPKGPTPGVHSEVPS